MSQKNSKPRIQKIKILVIYQQHLCPGDSVWPHQTPRWLGKNSQGISGIARHFATRGGPKFVANKNKTCPYPKKKKLILRPPPPFFSLKHQSINKLVARGGPSPTPMNWKALSSMFHNPQRRSVSWFTDIYCGMFYMLLISIPYLTLYILLLKLPLS